MGSRRSEVDDHSTADSTPEDVAVLYSWANIKGAKYRDYSASRREYRAQVRYRAAKALLERELEARLRAEKNAADAERVARMAEAGTDAAASAQRFGEPSLRTLEEAARKASEERLEAARRAEAAARAAVLALREEREVSKAHSNARRQALVYEEAEQRRRELAGPQPRSPFGEPHPSLRAEQGDLRSPEDAKRFLFSNWQDAVPIFDPRLYAVPSFSVPEEALAGQQAAKSEDQPDSRAVDYDAEQPATPAWLFPAQSSAPSESTQRISTGFRADAAAADTLLGSRERVAARWLALRGVFAQGEGQLPAMPALHRFASPTPIVAVFSLSGGVGKTSLIATLARAFAGEGEQIALADTTGQGLLPVYFESPHSGRNAEGKPPGEPSPDELPVRLIAPEMAQESGEDRRREQLAEQILHQAEGSQRLLLDLSAGSAWLVERLADLHPVVLVPMTPDMNAVISLQAVERHFRGIADRQGRPVLPFYVLNKFDAALPLHLDVREVLRRQLGDRLLRFSIRRSPAVGEALADGMTVLDYAPEAPVAQDYRDIAAWLRSISPAATEASAGASWEER